MTGPVQTRCACGHSIAAHQGGPCQGITVFGVGERGPAAHRGMELCSCGGQRDTYTVPAIAVAVAR